MDKKTINFDELESYDLETLLSTRLKEVGLSVRVLNCLDSEDIVTFRDLTKVTKMDLLKIHKFGMTSLREVDTLMESLRLNFAINK